MEYTDTSIEIKGSSISPESQIQANDQDKGLTAKQITMRNTKPPVEMSFRQFIDGIAGPMRNISVIEEAAAADLDLLLDPNSVEYQDERTKIQKNLYEFYYTLTYGMWNLVHTANKGQSNSNATVVIQEIDENTGAPVYGTRARQTLTATPIS